MLSSNLLIFQEILNSIDAVFNFLFSSWESTLLVLLVCCALIVVVSASCCNWFCHHSTRLFHALVSHLFRGSHWLFKCHFPAKTSHYWALIADSRWHRLILQVLLSLRFDHWFLLCDEIFETSHAFTTMWSWHWQRHGERLFACCG